MNSGGGDVERDLECADAGEPLRENGKAGGAPSRAVTPERTSSPRMLVGLDILCLIVGKTESPEVAYPVSPHWYEQCVFMSREFTTTAAAECRNE